MRDSHAGSEVWILYLGGYGNPKIDPTWGLWARGSQNSPNISDVLVPQLGFYSSHDREILRKHMALIRQSGADVIVFPWVGLDAGTHNRTFSDATLTFLYPLAHKAGLQVLPLIPNYNGRMVPSVLENIEYWRRAYGAQRSQYQLNGKPAIVIYDAFELADAWDFLRSMSGLTFIATGNSEIDFQNAFEDGYAGYLTYFASDAVTWASDPSHWERLANAARDRGILFVPTVSPGYNDSVVNPRNVKLHMARNCSDTYARKWRAAISVRPKAVMINSFNDWGEGSQIEPALPRDGVAVTDEFWCQTAVYRPNFYIEKTLEWVNIYKQN